jgi:hypothetical protein
MTDKLRKTQPTKITFADGEQPSSSKLNALADQSRNGSNIIERAVGDPWNQSGDSLLTSTPTQIPNISRMIGENKYLNPAIFPMSKTFLFREAIGTTYDGKTEGYLTFIPGATPSYTARGTASGRFTTLKGNEQDVQSSGDFWIDPFTGRFRLNDPLTGGEILEYQVDPQSHWSAGTEGLPGIIPDPRQTEFTSVRVEGTIGAGPYYIHLPPRRPLNFTVSGLDYDGDVSRPDRYPKDVEIEHFVLDESNQARVVPGGGSGKDGHTGYLYWQAENWGGVFSTFALDDEYYRYSLPKEILDGTFSAGEEYPSGYMYLWNKTTGTIIEDVVFKKPSDGNPRKWVIEVESSEFDFTTTYVDPEDGEAESATAYNDSNLVLITCGSPLARSLWRLTSDFQNHRHGRNRVMDTVISHNSLIEMDPPVDDTANEHYGRYPTYLGPWEASRWNNDPHDSLLSRAGSQSDPTRQRDQFNNAMLGNLILANADTAGGENYLDDTVPDNSFGIYFGDLTGASIVNTTSGLEIQGDPGLNKYAVKIHNNRYGGRALYVLASPDHATEPVVEIQHAGAGPGRGIITYGGASGGEAIYAVSQHNSYSAVRAQGKGTSNAVWGIADANGTGVNGQGSGTGGYGIRGESGAYNVYASGGSANAGLGSVEGLYLQPGGGGYRDFDGYMTVRSGPNNLQVHQSNGIHGGVPMVVWAGSGNYNNNYVNSSENSFFSGPAPTLGVAAGDQLRFWFTGELIATGTPTSVDVRVRVGGTSGALLGQVNLTTLNDKFIVQGVLSVKTSTTWTTSWSAWDTTSGLVCTVNDSTGSADFSTSEQWVVTAQWNGGGSTTPTATVRVYSVFIELLPKEQT